MPPTNTRAPTRPATATATPIVLPATFRLDSYEWIPQTWNNCGPANLAQILNYYGIKTTQKDTASCLKPNANDVNVTPRQLVNYPRQFPPLPPVTRSTPAI